MRNFRSSPGDARLREIASKNRACYKRLRKELEELTDHGLRMLKSLQRPGANIMQRLAVSNKNPCSQKQIIPENKNLE